MTPERYQQVKELFESALDREPDQRAAFLDEACADDPSLRKDIDYLLACHAEADSFMEIPAIQDASQLLTDDEAASVVGRRIGPYQIIREIGQGGMGAVYLAARADDQFRKQVAIKLIRPGMDTDDLLRRFRTERQILASLDHPNIAKLLDGGTTVDGLPYLVMDYVEGLPLDVYRDRRNLSIVERLNLFRAVCSAVHYAHQNLVVHRDLKPSNILVTADGTPKLLDFGIAKILNPTLVSQTIAPTTAMARPFTPDYASPEQVRGEPITTASDVYSLGVLLYELLTGHRPYRLASYTPVEIERIVCEEEPEKPSLSVAWQAKSEIPNPKSETNLNDLNSKSKTARASGSLGFRILNLFGNSRFGFGISRTDGKLRKQLSGDLDTIVLMAMRKEPQRRYTSVEQFSEDIRRHLDGLPVIARKDTVGYRAGKFVKRHTVGVAAAALVVLTLVGGIVATAWQAKIAAEQARVATEQRDRARVAAAKAERINLFLQGLIGAANPAYKGTDVKVIEVMEEAAARVDKELADQPEVLAEAHLTIGETYFSMSRFDQAETHYRAALDTSRKALGDEHPTTALSMTYMGAILARKGLFADAESSFRQALDVQRRAFPEGNYDTGVTLSALGELLREKGDPKAAEPLSEEALGIARRLFGEEHQHVATVLTSIGLTREVQRDLDGAQASYRRAIEIYRKLPGRPSAMMGRTLTLLGRNLTTKGEYTEAETVLREAVDFNSRVGVSPGVFYADSLTELALLYFFKGEYANAEDVLRKALEIQRRVLSKDNPYVAATLVPLGLALTRAGKPAAGEPYLREALSLRRKSLAPDHWALANTESALGECLTGLKRYTEAEPLLLKSYPTLKSKLGDQHPRTVDAL
jgi:serine/threonine-protein kinase